MMSAAEFANIDWSPLHVQPTAAEIVAEMSAQTEAHIAEWARERGLTVEQLAEQFEIHRWPVESDEYKGTIYFCVEMALRRFKP